MSTPSTALPLTSAVPAPADEPILDTPAVAADAPALESPAAETPLAEVPAAETPLAEVPAAEVPAAEGPAASADASAAEAPAVAPATETPPGPSAPPVFPSSPPAPHISQWERHAKAVGSAFYAWLIRPRVRLTVTGVVLLMIGGLVVTSSVWTLPIVIVGALMVLVAWIGSRLDGQFGVEWGESGTQVQFRAKIKSAQPTAPALIAAPQVAPVTAEEPEDADIVEGEAHTVEIDVTELRALIAAAEAEEAGQRAKVAALRLAKTAR
jgi:hypothetical protein